MFGDKLIEVLKEKNINNLIYGIHRVGIYFPNEIYDIFNKESNDK